MAVCLLVLLATTPALDAVICQDDAVPAASASAVSTNADGAQLIKVTAVKGEAAPHSAPHSGDVGDACPHGHCHHFSASVDDEPLRPVQTAFLDVRTDDLRQREPPSLPGSTPERPPRA